MSSCTDDRIGLKLADEAEKAVQKGDLDRASRLLDLYAKIALIGYIKGETR